MTTSGRPSGRSTPRWHFSTTAPTERVPARVLRHQADLRAEMEAEPVRFLGRDLDDRPRRRARGARRLRGRRPRRSGVREQRHRRRQRGAALAAPGPGRRAAHHRPRLPGLSQHARLRGRAQRHAGRHGHAAVPGGFWAGDRGHRDGRRHPAHPSGPARPHHEPDRPHPADRARCGGPRRPRGRGRGGRRPCARHGAARSPRARRGLLQRATATSGSARRRAPRSSSCGAIARPTSPPDDQPRRGGGAAGALPLPARGSTGPAPRTRPRGSRCRWRSTTWPAWCPAAGRR